MNKFFWLIVLWAAIIFVYVILMAAWPAVREITGLTAETLNSTSNMSQYPGMLPAVQSAPIWLFIIPGGVGIVWSIWLLKS